MSAFNLQIQCLFLANYSSCILLFAGIVYSAQTGPADPICTRNILSLEYYANILVIFQEYSARGLIQGGVNVACSRKKKALRNVRVSKRSGPVRPGSSYNVYQFELHDRCCVSFIIPPKSRLAEILDFGTQV